MTDTTPAPPAHDVDDRTLIENAAADAAAGILPGNPSGLAHDIDLRAMPDDAADRSGDADANADGR